MAQKAGQTMAAKRARAAVTEASEAPGGALPLTGPTQLVAQSWYVLNRAAKRAREHVEAALQPLGLRRRHYAALGALGAEGALSQQELGSRIPIDRATMVVVVDDLEKLGFVERHADPADRRAYQLHLTPAGTRALADANLRVKAAEDAALAPLSPPQRRQLDRFVRILCGWSPRGS